MNKNNERDEGGVSSVNRLIKRDERRECRTSCDSLVVEWSVAIASTRVQFPVTAFLIFFTSTPLTNTKNQMIVQMNINSIIYYSSPQNSSCSSSIQSAYESPKPSPPLLPTPHQCCPDS